MADDGSGVLDGRDDDARRDLDGGGGGGDEEREQVTGPDPEQVAEDLDVMGLRAAHLTEQWSAQNEQEALDLRVWFAALMDEDADGEPMTRDEAIQFVAHRAAIMWRAEFGFEGDE